MLRPTNTALLKRNTMRRSCCSGGRTGCRFNAWPPKSGSLVPDREPRGSPEPPNERTALRVFGVQLWHHTLSYCCSASSPTCRAPSQVKRAHASPWAFQRRGHTRAGQGPGPQTDAGCALLLPCCTAPHSWPRPSMAPSAPPPTPPTGRRWGCTASSRPHTLEAQRKTQRLVFRPGGAVSYTEAGHRKCCKEVKGETLNTSREWLLSVLTRSG